MAGRRFDVADVVEARIVFGHLDESLQLSR
jgi:hypothetical protein